LLVVGAGVAVEVGRLEGWLVREPVVDGFSRGAGEGRNAAVGAGGLVGGADDLEDAAAVFAGGQDSARPSMTSTKCWSSCGKPIASSSYGELPA
jgi:hypothetical protein